ncbi:HVA1 family protein [Flavilitoribacter nigricans]|uniref:Hypervirulence associated protein TUDOR domain-containing protein n=1 Tax=Flavilitoribacter nigricans (strain ATCC 23147 / DSM 23189 / NBRC 102662 / NCIMB 1420 / SS-2) TaxID=1122177 RepID=A0A2D0N2I2_FLAN2|nr:HVA1 family protein [Flavilitoribacter nigricans]PHN02731.1 hypothetical protein CRP01_30575 [Flavilitoribacter nigricans DSM 23189 = NBRC 102662]
MKNKGVRVEWKEEEKTITGKIVERSTEITGEIIDGQMVTRRGRPENEALHIETADGQPALKLESEVTLKPRD